MVNDFASSFIGKVMMWGTSQYKESQKDPLGYNLNLATNLAIATVMVATEPAPYSGGYNSSVTTQESMSALGTLRFGVKRNNLAFGLGTKLDEFSQATGFMNYRQFTSGGFNPNEIKSAIQNPENNLHFNLQDFTRWRYLKYIANPGKPGLNNITNWELHTIYNTTGALQRTTFYNFTNGGYQITKPPF